MFVTNPAVERRNRRMKIDILPMTNFTIQFKRLAVTVRKYGINELSEYLCHKKTYEKLISITIAKTNP